jgi:hypothetical protein
MDMTELQNYFAGRVVSLIEMSVGEAILRSEINAPKGVGSVGPIRRIDADEIPVQRPAAPPE